VFYTPRLQQLAGVTADGVLGQVEQLKSDIYDFLIIGGTFAGFIASVLTWLAGLFTAGVSTVLIIDAANAIADLAGAVFDGEIDSTALDKFKCIVYCCLTTVDTEEPTRFSQVGYDYILTQIDEQFSGDEIQRLFFAMAVRIMGTVGMNIAARIGDADGTDCDDCTDCPSPWCRKYALNSTSLNGWNLDVGTTTTDQVVTAVSGSFRYVQTHFDVSPDVFLGGLTVHYSYGGGGASPYVQVQLKLGGSTVYDTTAVGIVAGDNQDYHFDLLPQVEFDAVYVYLVASQEPTTGDGGIYNVALLGDLTPIPPGGTDCA